MSEIADETTPAAAATAAATCRPVVRLLVLGLFAEARGWTVLVELSVMEQRVPGGWERDRPMHLWQMDVMGASSSGFTNQLVKVAVQLLAR